MVELEFLKRDGSDPLTINDDAIISLNATLTNTGVATFSATLKGDRRLERRAQRQDRVNIKTNDTKVAAYLTNVSHTRSNGDTRIRGKGIAKQLQEGRPDNRPVVYDNVFAGDAIEDYWSRTPFGNVTVTKQTGDIVVSDSLTQSADTTTEWNNVVSIASDVPAYIDNGRLKQAQSGFVDERDGSSPDVDYSNGSAEICDTTTQNFFYTFENNYEIENPTFYLRRKQRASGDFTTLEVSVDGSFEGNLAPDANPSLQWESVSLSNLPKGQHTVKVNPAQNIPGSYGVVDFDVFAVVDSQFTYNFDNTVDEDNGHLDGPALYPADANPVITTNPTTTTTRNITEAAVTTTFDDTSNDQRLGLSDDGGTNFQRGDNSNSFTASFTDAGRELVTEFRLSGYDNGAQNATPRFNYLGQTADSFETTVDLDDRVVFVGLEVSKNHFENLQKLHSNSNYVFTIDHDSSSVANMPVFSFPRGEETRSSSVINDNEIDESPAVEGEQFYNVIPLEGGLNGGTRPFEEVKDQDSIDDIGEEISPGLLRDPTISSDIEAQFIAQALLKKAVSNGELRGTKTIPPTFAPTPGFAYPVSWLDDDTREVTLEEVSVTKSGNSAETTLDFTGRTGFASQINELRRQARETQDEI